MKIIKQFWKFNKHVDGLQLLKDIEIAGRTCYKSEEKITDSSAPKFVKKMINSGHHAMIEFAQIPPVKITTDRGISHEIVRHRLFSFAQESTRYCNYSNDKFNNEITVILPVWLYDSNSTEHVYSIWEDACKYSEAYYFKLLNDFGWSPQEARSVLPNSLKTEINIAGNAREWRHFFTLRTSLAAHPQIRHIANDMLEGFKQLIPVLFDDIKGDNNNV